MSRALTHTHALTASLYANTARNRNCMVSRSAWAADKVVELPPERIWGNHCFLCASFLQDQRLSSRWFADRWGPGGPQYCGFTAEPDWLQTEPGVNPTNKILPGFARSGAELGLLWSPAPDCRCLRGKANASLSPSLSGPMALRTDKDLAGPYKVVNWVWMDLFSATPVPQNV